MKKFLILVSMLSLFITSCSSDDSSSSNNVESNIMIDGVRFVPGTNDENFDYVFTSFDTNQLNGTANTRVFGFSNDSQDLASLEQLQIDVVYPSAQSSIDGTYSFDSSSTLNSYASISYSKGPISYTTQTGTVTISDLGNNKFKIQFDGSITLTDFLTSTQTKVLTGYYKGTFALDSN